MAKISKKDGPVLLTREDFKKAVFDRDNQSCLVCKNPAVDAHHIIERRLFREPHEQGGYFLDNGASVCSPCHIKAETTEIDAQDLRDMAGIDNIVLPAHLYKNTRYDKWGNIIQPNGMRLKGELFHEEPVQKMLSQGNMLSQFTHLVKAPRTFHLPWSEGLQSDDRVVADMSRLEKCRRVIVTRKMDGENTSIYKNDIHARSIDGRAHPSQNRIKAWAAGIQQDIPEDWRVGGENLTARHSIAYEALPHFFMGFALWDEHNVCLGWDDMLEWFDLIGITPVPVLYDGPWDERAIKALYDPINDRDIHEGYVVRDAGPIRMQDYGIATGKYVRAQHVQTNEKHWASGPVIENGFNL